MDTIWMAEGNCAHEKPTVFFPSDGVGVEVARYSQLRELCRTFGCAVNPPGRTCQDIDEVRASLAECEA